MLRVITLFSGYDSQCLALNRLGLPYELAAWCEIDKHAITAHNALFPQWSERNLGDVSKVDWAEWHKQHPQQIDLLTYSSPCQDFSSAGLQRGGEEGSGTRSGLLWETERAVRELRPRHLVFENVGGLVSDKFIDLFNRWQARLNGYGYTNFSQLMNAKDYGVPQNRLRIFMVSILDCQRAYYFPKPFRLERRLKDVLEQNVEERYYLSDDRVAKLMTETEIHRERGNGFAFCPHTPEEIASTVKCSGIGDKTDNFVAEPAIIDDVFYDREPRVYDTVSPTIRSSHDIFKVAEPQINIIGNLYDSNEQAGRIYDSNGIAPTLDNMASGGNKSPKIVEPTIYGLPHGHYKGDLYTDYAPTVKSSAYAANNPLIEPCIAAMRGRDKDNPNDRGKSNDNYVQRLELKTDGTSNTLTSVAKDNLLIEPQFHDADDIPFDDGKGGFIWAKYESEEYERLMNEYWEKEWEKYIQRGIQLTLGMNEPSVLTPVRTEYGKAIRKQYGDNNLPESRHNLTQLQPKQDGTSNTITTVAKDNLLIIPKNINNEQTRIFTEINEANTREVLRILWQEVGAQTFCEKMGRLDRFQQAQVLQQGVHEESVCQDGHNNAEQRHDSQLGTAHSVDRGEQGEGVRDMREERGQAGCASQGRELEEQFLGEFNDCLSQLPSETPQAEECLRYLRQATSDWSWLLQQTLSTLEEVRQSADGERKYCQGIRIRRLSERELYRLMDVSEPDIDTLLNAPIPRTQHAKLAGNSIVIACLYNIFRNIFVDTEPAASTQTTLF